MVTTSNYVNHYAAAYYGALETSIVQGYGTLQRAAKRLSTAFSTTVQEETRQFDRTLLEHYITAELVEPIGEGATCRAYKTESSENPQVYKISQRLGVGGVWHGDYTREEVLEIKEKLIEDQRLCQQYLGHEYVPTATFLIGDYVDQFGEARAKLFQQQPFVQGIDFYQGLKEAESGSYDTSAVIDFLNRCLIMYKEEGVIPDLTGTPWFPFWISPKRTPNVILVKEGEKLIPQLIDTDSGYLNKLMPVLMSVRARMVHWLLLELQERQELKRREKDLADESLFSKIQRFRQRILRVYEM